MTWGYYRPFRTLSEPWALLGDLRRDIENSTASEYPLVNIWTENDKCYLAAELPGIDFGDIDLTILGNTLTIQGKKHLETEADIKFLRRERGSGEFSRTVELPFNVNPENSEANLKNGILTVILTRTVEDRPKKVSIRRA